MGTCGTKKKSMKDFLKDEGMSKAALLEEAEAEDNAGQPHENVQLSFKCENVKDVGLTEEPNTVLVLKSQKEEKQWDIVGSTEVVKQELNPVYVQPIIVEYYPQELQQ